MAIIKMSGIGVVEIRNKLGGTVFITGRGGAAVRNIASPVNRQSASQQLNRVELASFSSGWRSLTPSERLAWSSQAQLITKHNQFGDTVKMTGINYYIEANKNLLEAGMAAITDPVALEGVSNPLSLTITTNTSAAQVLTLDAAIAANNAVAVYATAPQSAGVAAFKGKYRYIATFPAAHAAALNTFADYVAKFGTPVTGMAIGFAVKAINTNTGQAGVPLNGNSITA